MAVFMNIRKLKKYRGRRDVSPNSIKRLLRFETENVDFITDYFLSKSNETRGGALASRKQMKIFLRYDPGFQSGVANDFGVDRKTVCKTVDYVKQKIMKKANQWIVFPSSELDFNEAKTM